jgi:hypothetical protein
MLARPRPVNKPKAPTPKRRNSTANKFVGAGYLERTSGAVLEVGAMPWTYFGAAPAMAAGLEFASSSYI